MADTVSMTAETVLEVVSPDGSRRYVRVTQTPFLIGRGAETGNHLQLSDRRISRSCAAIVLVKTAPNKITFPVADLLRDVLAG